jgi:glycosyltransferase involved in cell wall biosynthesis
MPPLEPGAAPSRPGEGGVPIPGLVSAIVIFLDAERFLGEAIDSILAQTHPRIELLLVDDGSSDGSVAIAEGCEARHAARVRVLRHPGGVNRGMSASRNLGMHHARGEFVAFLDADDVWLPAKSAEQVAILQADTSLGAVYGHTQIWHSWDPDTTIPDSFYALGVETDRPQSPPRLFSNLLENRFQSPTTCNAMMRAEAARAVGGFEDAFRGMYEDQAFFAKLLLGWPVYVSSAPWARYRQHAGNSGSHYAPARYFIDRQPLLRFVCAYARAHEGLLDRRARAVLAREAWKAEHPGAALKWQRCVRWWRRTRREWTKRRDRPGT